MIRSVAIPCPPTLCYTALALALTGCLVAGGDEDCTGCLDAETVDAGRLDANTDAGRVDDDDNDDDDDACPDCVEPDDPESYLSAASVQTAGAGRSLFIRRATVLNQLNEKFDMGFLLGAVGRYENRAADSDRTVGDYVFRVFDLAHQEQLENARHDRPIGLPPFRNRYQDAVLRNWRDQSGRRVGENRLRNMTNPDDLRGGTFRLLAVVNRLDLAGDFDDRLTGIASVTPRYLGEVHLVFGLVDRDFESGEDGTPFPGTYVMSYRLPALRTKSDGSLGVARDFDDRVFAEGGPEWRRHIQRWASLWADLAEHEIESPQYQRRLERILRLATGPRTFLSLKSNVEVRNNTWELREWYVFRSGSTRDGNASGLLIPRKLRREPYRCLEQSDALGALVDHYWRDEFSDLDMTTRRPNLARGSANDELRAGYAVLRDHRRPFMEDYRLATANRSNYYWSDECGRRQRQMPFAMPTGEGRAQEPTGRIATDLLMFLAPYARVDGAGPVWQLNEGSDEPQRHAFAIRTCSGCHSQEGAARGFHVSPRLQGQRSELSSYLTGEAGNTFSIDTPDGPVEYTYDTLETRRRWLNSVLDGDAVLFESLMRPERHH